MDDRQERPAKARTILNLIRVNQPVSRTEIQRLTGIRLATITDITRELIDDGAVKEGGVPAGDGKPKKKALYINHELYHIVGADIRPRGVIAVRTNLRGDVLDQAETAFDPDSGGSGVLRALFAGIHAMLERDCGKVLGLGISCPATLDREKGAILLSSQLEQLNGTPLRREAEKEFNLPVFLEASTHLKLLAERWFGCAQNADDVLYVELGRGIAVSIVSGGRFVKGSFGVEGELGHTVVDPGGSVCVCGNRGCLETVASSDRIERKVREILGQGAYSLIRDYLKGDEAADIHAIARAAEAGDRIAVNVMEDAAKYIGLSIANVVNVVGPRIVVFGGEAIGSSDYIVQSVIRAILANALSGAGSALEFRVSDLKEMAGALGAAAMVLEYYFRDVAPNK